MSEEFENSTTQVEHEYGGSEIQVLEGLEAVRKRPGMYIGSTSESGLHHLVYEIVDNSIDEALAGYCDEITVKIGEGDIITVIDNGRGIPVDIQPQTGLPALRWCSRSSTPAANSAAAAIRCPAASTAWAPAWSTPCPSGWKCGFTRRARSTR